ncbi:MAG: hypothetical protein Q4E65_04630 [Clostridia bacterium]|nr:hypothetical protein [Clostridia bacterium]
METNVKTNAAAEESLTMQALMEKIEKNVAKQTRWARLQLYSSFLCVIILVVALLALGMKVFPLLDQLSTTLTNVNTTITEMDLVGLTENVNTLIDVGTAGIETAMGDVEDAMVGVNDALKTVSSLDIEGMNESIGNLNDVSTKMAKVFGIK